MRINENRLKDNAVNVINNYHLTQTCTLAETIVEGQVYTVSIVGSLAGEKEYFGLFGFGVLPGRRFSRSNLFGGVGC